MNASHTAQLSPAVRADLNKFKAEVGRFQDGHFTDRMFKALRVPRGFYEQRTSHTYMARVRIPGGTVSTTQLRAVARTAREYGSGLVHLTTRQDLQIHYVGVAEMPDLVDALAEVGLSAKGGGGNTVRNITGCFLAGVCADEVFDVRPTVVALTEHLLDQPDSFNLPRKFKIAASGCATDCALATFNDVGLVARQVDGVRGYEVWAAGGMGQMSRAATRLETFVPETDIGHVVMALKRLFQDHGDRRNRSQARLRFVIERMGEGPFEALYREYLAREQKLPSATAAVRAFPPAANGEVAAVKHSADGAEAPENSGASSDNTFERWRRLNVRQQRQPDRVSAIVGVPLGHIMAEQLVAFADLVDGHEGAEVRVTPRQDFALVGLRPEALPELHRDLGTLDGGLDRADDSRAVVACTGADTCRLGICLSGGLASAIEAEVAEFDKVVPIHVNGCPNACGQHPVAAIGLQGKAQRLHGKLVPSYRVGLGGRAGPGRARQSEPIGDIAARDVPTWLQDTLSAWESASGADFHDWLDAGGRQQAQALLERHADRSGRSGETDLHVDWGADRPFSLAGRGEGECGAGTLALIEDDLRLAQGRLRKAKRSKEPAPLLLEAVLAAARALLVTRSVEGSSPAGTFLLFAEHFVARQLVDPAVLRLFRRALERPEDLPQAREQIEALVDRVRELYESLDAASLEFSAAPVALSGDVVQRLPPRKVEQAVTSGRWRVLDVRDVDEWRGGRLLQAKLLPWNGGELQAAAADLPSDDSLLLVCASGVRSLRAAMWLAEQGFTSVATLDGGLDAWREAGFPVEKAD